MSFWGLFEAGKSFAARVIEIEDANARIGRNNMSDQEHYKTQAGINDNQLSLVISLRRIIIINSAIIISLLVTNHDGVLGILRALVIAFGSSA